MENAVKEWTKKNISAEKEAIRMYELSYAAAVKARDKKAAKLFAYILKDEKDHLNLLQKLLLSD